MIKINVIPATIADYPVIQNLARFYVYDMSRYCGFISKDWAIAQDGLYECFDLKKYFIDTDKKAYLVKLDDGELVGFVLLDKQSTSGNIDYNMGEFFVLAKFQGKGIASEIAKKIWAMHPGKWEISVIPENTPAFSFWRKNISAITNGNYLEEIKIIDYDKDQPHRIIFEFNTMDDFIAINDVGVLNIPIVENNEAMIDLRNQGIVAFGPSPEIPNNTDYTYLRKTVYDKLVEAQSLLPSDLKFCLYEGYRSLELQKKLFDDRYQKLKDLNPELNHQKLFTETTKMVSPVTNLDGSINIPPHSTGGAFDIYLIDKNSQIIDMGIKVADWTQDVDGSISKTSSNKISLEAKENRAIMSNALIKVGFVNYPGEYWHWSYGDRYWAYHKNEVKAIYGSIN